MSMAVKSNNILRMLTWKICLSYFTWALNLLVILGSKFISHILVKTFLNLFGVIMSLFGF